MQCAEGASARCTGAGVAVESGGTDVLYGPFVNVTRAKALKVCVKEQSGINLNQFAFGGLVFFEPI